MPPVENPQAALAVAEDVVRLLDFRVADCRTYVETGTSRRVDVSRIRRQEVEDRTRHSIRKLDLAHHRVGHVHPVAAARIDRPWSVGVSSVPTRIKPLGYAQKPLAVNILLGIARCIELVKNS